MANYLICDICQHKNTVNSERIVFCKGCQKKLSNNYLDWKKSKFNSSFETYVDSLKEYNETIPLKQDLEEAKEKKESIFKSSISSPSKTSFIFIASILIQLLIAAIIIQSTDENITTVGRKSSYPANPTLNYINDVKWGTYPITQTLSLSAPFELKESESVLPSYMENYISNHKSSKAESSLSFSLTVEKMNFDAVYKIQNADLVSINDRYMQSSGVALTKDEGLHTEINGYKAYVEHGSYILNGQEYLYENYTLTKGDEGVKIILSYLKHDDLLCKYADIVSQSLLNNKQLI